MPTPRITEREIRQLYTRANRIARGVSHQLDRLYGRHVQASANDPTLNWASQRSSGTSHKVTTPTKAHGHSIKMPH